MDGPIAILIKNPETERKARELARLTGKTITSAIEAALDMELAHARPKRRPTVEEMLAATRLLHADRGLEEPAPPVTREDFDALWEDATPRTVR